MSKKDAKPTHQFFAEIGSFATAIRIILMAEMVAVIIALGRSSVLDKQAWNDLNFFSAYALLVAFMLIISLRLLSPILRRVSMVSGSIVTYVLLLGVALIGGELIIYILYDLQYIPQRWPVWRNEFLIRSLVVSAIVGIPTVRMILLRQRALYDARTQQDARLQALQSRIRPHFLFNSLNSVAGLTRKEPDKAEAVLHDLADLFRVLLADARKLVPISAEQEISRQYLEIEKIRLGKRLKIKWNISNIPRSAQIPALTLQPLLENAIYHGIEPRFAGGTIRIDMWTEDNLLNIMISNPLPDVAHKRLSKGNQIAQDNIRQRLSTQYGSAASMQAFEDGGQYHVKVKMPIHV